MKPDLYLLQQKLFTALNTSLSDLDQRQDTWDNTYQKFSEYVEERMGGHKEDYNTGNGRFTKEHLETFGKKWQAYIKHSPGRRKTIPKKGECIADIRAFRNLLEKGVAGFRRQTKSIDVDNYDSYSVFLGYYGYQDFQKQNEQEIEAIRTDWKENRQKEAESHPHTTVHQGATKRGSKNTLLPSSRFIRYSAPLTVVLLVVVYWQVWRIEPDTTEPKRIKINELSTQFISKDSRTFKLLIVPFFKKPIDIADYGYFNEKQLLNRFLSIKEEDSLDLEVRFVIPDQVIDQPSQARSITDTTDIDMILWGQFESNCHAGNRICINYTTSGRVFGFEGEQPSKQEGSSQFQALQFSSTLSDGYLQESIDNIVFWTLANYYSKRGKNKKAWQSAELIIRPNECNSEVLSKTAFWAFRAQELDRALELTRAELTCRILGKAQPNIAYQELFALNTSDTSIIDSSVAWAWGDLGNALSFKEKTSDSLSMKAYQKSLQVIPDNDIALMRLGMMHERSDLDSAIGYFEKLVEVNPELEILGDEHIGDLYQRKGNVKKAAEHYVKALQNNPDNAFAMVSFGQLFARTGDTNSARQLFQRAVEVESENWSIWDDKGSFHVAIGEYETAVSCYDRSIELNNDYKKLWLFRARAYKGMEAWEKAITSYERATEIDSNYTVAWLEEYEVHLDLNNSSEALKTLERAAELNPESSEVHEKLADFYLILGRSEAARLSYEKVLELHEGCHPVSRLYIGNSYMIDRNYPEALQSYKLALDKICDCHKVVTQFEGYFEYFSSMGVDHNNCESMRDSLSLYCDRKHSMKS